MEPGKDFRMMSWSVPHMILLSRVLPDVHPDVTSLHSSCSVGAIRFVLLSVISYRVLEGDVNLAPPVK